MVTLSSLPKAHEINHQENGMIHYIHLSVLVGMFLVGFLFVCFWVFTIYSELWPGCSWNVPDNNLPPNTICSALMVLIQNTFGVLCHLSIKMFPKDEDSLIDNVLFTSMSLVSEAAVAKHLKCLLLQSLCYVHCIQIRTNSECKSSSKLADSGHQNSCKNEPDTAGSESQP